MKGRSTIDIVVILLSGMVAATVFLSAIGMIVAKAINPSLDIKEGSTFIGNTLSTVVTSLIAFVGGRAFGRGEANGKQ